MIIDYNIAVTTLSEGNAELCVPDTRTLSIEYPTGDKSTIIIQGTTMIPEFSSSFLVPTVILLSMMCVVLARTIPTLRCTITKGSKV